MARNLARSSSGQLAVLGQGEHPGVEVEPRQLAVEEPLGRIARAADARAARLRCSSPGHRPMLLRRLRSRPDTGPNAPKATGIVREGNEHRPPLRRAHAVRAAGVRPRGRACAATPCITVSMAGSLFFRARPAPPGARCCCFLLITMTPFAIVAPVLGPALDRTKGGRRLFLIRRRRAGRCCASLMAMYISKPAPEGLLVYPLAFGVLVLAKGEPIAKSALVPALVNDDAELVTANSRLALISVDRRVRSAALPAFAVLQSSSAPTGRCASRAVVFVVATILAIQIPRTATARARRRAAAAAGTGGAAHAEHPARPAARWPCCAAASASWRSSPRSRSRTTSSRSASCWRRQRASATSSACSSRPCCAARCAKR